MMISLSPAEVAVQDRPGRPGSSKSFACCKSLSFWGWNGEGLSLNQLKPVVLGLATRERRQGVPRCEVVDTKNGTSRMLYFPGEAGRLLGEMRASAALSRFVFARPDDHPDPAVPGGGIRPHIRGTRAETWSDAAEARHLEMQRAARSR
jgi:hypothetical protein